MPVGPGIYDDLCTKAREESDADVTILIIMGGNRGSGFSVQARDEKIMKFVPSMLEIIAEEIRNPEGEK